MERQAVARTAVFISYSHKDVRFLEELRIHLAPLERYADILWWEDSRIDPGEDWRGKISEAIGRAKIAVLLISHYFLASEFIAKDELPPLLEMAEKDSAVILPVILRPSLFLRIEELARYRTVNSPDKPLVDLSEGECDKVWVKLAEKILDTLGDGKLTIKKRTPLLGRVTAAQNVGNIQKGEMADLDIVVSGTPGETEAGVVYNLNARNSDLGIHYTMFGPAKVRNNYVVTFNRIKEEMHNLSDVRYYGESVVRRRLEALGSSLVRELFPEELVSLLGKLRGLVRSVRIVSEETWIPWEMLRIRGDSAEEFFCEAFAISRWIPGTTGVWSVSANSMAVVMPRGHDLRFGREEIQLLSSLAAGKHFSMSEVTATYLDVTDALASGQFDWWHLVAHSIFQIDKPDLVRIMLESPDSLVPSDLSGSASKFGEKRPIFFLSGPLIHGWAAELLKGGAGAVVGPYWAPSDTVAHAFAVAFYKNFFSGTPIGESVLKARLEARDKNPGDPSWLAYTVFANPEAKIKSPVFGSGEFEEGFA